MYIRRKVFSSIVDEKTGEERLFSTTEFINEEEYQKEFAKKHKGSGRNKRISNEDIEILKSYKEFKDNPHDAEEMREYYTNGRRTVRGLAKDTAQVGLGGGIIGAAYGVNKAIKKNLETGASLKKAGKYGLIGAGLGAGLGLGVSLGGQAYVKKKLKENPNFAMKERDAIDVATGEMTRAQFRKKYGVDYDKIDEGKDKK